MIPRKWENELCVVAATGPSLDQSVADECMRAKLDRGIRIIAVNDAYKLLPFADVLFAADVGWLDVHRGAMDFGGEKWSVYARYDLHNRERKIAQAEKYGLNLVTSVIGDGFSLDPENIHGCNSGFHGINLAVLFGSNPIVMVGFNMRRLDGRSHFFGDHPKPLYNDTEYHTWVPFFDKARELLPNDIRIVNATPRSAIKCFETMTLTEALRI